MSAGFGTKWQAPHFDWSALASAQALPLSSQRRCRKRHFSLSNSSVLAWQAVHGVFCSGIIFNQGCGGRAAEADHDLTAGSGDAAGRDARSRQITQTAAVAKAAHARPAINAAVLRRNLMRNHIIRQALSGAMPKSLVVQKVPCRSAFIHSRFGQTEMPPNVGDLCANDCAHIS
jgi:hypothetical protein